MVKKLVCLISIIFCLAMFCGCKDEPNKDFDYMNVEIIAIDKAFDNEWITQNDLMSIANYHNNNVNLESLEDSIASLIKETAAYKMRNDKNHAVIEAKQEDFKILKYYGNYNGCYAIILNHPYEDVPAEVINEWVIISDVEFHYTSYDRIVIWKNLQGEIQ